MLWPAWGDEPNSPAPAFSHFEAANQEKLVRPQKLLGIGAELGNNTRSNASVACCPS